MKNTKKRLVIFCILLALPLCKADAQWLGLSAGGILNNNPFARSYAWKIEYYDNIADNFLWSFIWYNEGHIKNHHRDGMLLQAWYRQPLVQDKLFIAAGAGPFYFFDTTKDHAPGYEDVHAFAAGAGIDIWYYMTPRWALKTGAMFVLSEGANANTVSLTLGAIYKFEDEQTTRGRVPYLEYEGSNEITVYLGQTIVNSFQSQKSMAVMVDYRRNIFKYLDVSAAFLNEGDSDVIRRNGIIMQLWPTRRFAGGRLSLGAGLGAYIALDRHNNAPANTSTSALAGIITMSAGYRLSFAPISLRASWNRTVTSYNRDTDIIMGGVGYYF